ncbi:hypothetical protein [Mesorhizobium sp. M0678]|uniref:hypothetical protein n=1 Tax=Mesorhizobium sp. M0678 TaxID=2956985 RepID=UPI003335D548
MEVIGGQVLVIDEVHKHPRGNLSWAAHRPEHRCASPRILQITEAIIAASSA